MKLEKPKFKFKARKDRRPKMEEPPPVMLEAVDDVQLPKPVKRDQLVLLYTGILEFTEIPESFAFKASNFAVHFRSEAKDDRNYRPVRVVVPSISATEARLIEHEIIYERQKGITPGDEVLVLQDADGNWLEIRERRELG